MEGLSIDDHKSMVYRGGRIADAGRAPFQAGQ
jgi:hypothetical protein